MQTSLKPHDQRPGWLLANLLLLLVALLLALAMNGCMTFEKAFKRFGKTYTDTTYITDTTIVPKDSAVLHIVTDTTTVIQQVRQGRATIIYKRTPKTTIVKAECDSVVIIKQVPQYITKRVWGVDPIYKVRADQEAERANRWRMMFWMLLGTVLLTALILWLLSRFSIRFERKVDNSKPAVNPL